MEQTSSDETMLHGVLALLWVCGFAWKYVRSSLLFLCHPPPLAAAKLQHSLGDVGECVLHHRRFGMVPIALYQNRPPPGLPVVAQALPSGLQTHTSTAEGLSSPSVHHMLSSKT